ncbi:MAG: conjugal transfer protein TraF [Bacillota bacterium]|uniref:Conjugal transfer protein TraF n=1 Tax=Virgibacillus salarius TaxID=447199 RepID=A0A941ICE0_9BACI|nr:MULTISPECIES: conjugal transfer protein TraF [Virgibacillus]MBR7796080.1 conjugal transfer protein TraF [Virgibacillus salarius]MCC2250430.1 conjugal transfer protein TraF [Virgibacillus sp. AGTR]NAZ08791.1 conjugal transfer protein TraF [Agaribacter marinus]
MIMDVMITVILVLLIAVLGILYYMLKYNSNFLKQIQSIKGIQFNTLDIGEESPLFRVMDDNGKKVIAKQLFYNKNTLILFVNSKCPICKSILGKVDLINDNYDLNIIVINNDESLDDSLIKKLLPLSITYIRSVYITTAYHVYTTPMGVLIENGKVKQYSKISDFYVLNNMLVSEKGKQIAN